MRKISILMPMSALYLLFASPFTAYAQLGDWFKSEDVQARLVAGSDNMAALVINLDDGWHTYWRIPGDAGLPPMMSWAQSENIKNVDMQWPAPKRKKENEFHTIGYDTKVVFPLALSYEDESKPSTLNLTAQIMICKDICIPQKIEASLPIDKNAKPTEPNIYIKNALATVPQENADGLSIDSIVAANDSLLVSVTSQNGFEGMEIFPVIEEDYIALTLPPKIEISEHDSTKAILRVSNGTDFENIAGALQGKTLSATLTHGDTAIVKSVQY